jgi:hypothetical protein
MIMKTCYLYVCLDLKIWSVLSVCNFFHIRKGIKSISEVGTPREHILLAFQYSNHDNGGWQEGPTT